MYMQPDMKDNADNISNTCQRGKKKKKPTGHFNIHMPHLK